MTTYYTWQGDHWGNPFESEIHNVIGFRDSSRRLEAKLLREYVELIAAGYLAIYYNKEKGI